MKEIELTVICSCGFYVQRIFYTNEYGYFEISEAYCPECFNLLTWVSARHPMNILEVRNANKH